MSNLCFADISHEPTDPFRGPLRRTPVEASSLRPSFCGTVLIVDDDRDIRFLLRFILEELDYSVLEASDGREGLRLLRASGAERLIVLLDYRMPRMDGWALLREVASDATLAGRHTFALVTANVETLPASFRALLEEQAIPILAKPFHLDDLDALVQHCASRAASGDAGMA